MTCFILVRHGQTDWNRVERFRGRADVPLNSTGQAQAEATGKRVAATWNPAAIYSSPLSRAVDTAKAISRNFLLTKNVDLPVLVHPGLVDIDYGVWQGLTPDEARQRWPELVEAWYTTPQNVQIPGGESLNRLKQRGMAMLSELVAKHLDQTIVLAGHTVINRVILLGILGLDLSRFWRLRQEPCAINVIEWEKDDFTLVSLNDVSHLNNLQM